MSFLTSCCSGNTGVNPKFYEEIQIILKRISDVIPGTFFVVVLSSSGEVVSFENVKSARPQNLLAPISSIKKAAIQFANTLSQTECPIIHLRGNNSMFSCYEMGEYILVCCSENHSAALEALFAEDSGEIDKKIEAELQGLKLLIKNIIISSPS